MGLLLEQETPEQFFCCYGRYQAYLETPDEKRANFSSPLFYGADGLELLPATPLYTKNKEFELYSYRQSYWQDNCTGNNFTSHQT